MIAALRARLAAPLPGPEVRRRVLPPDYEPETPLPAAGMTDAAVLIALIFHPQNDTCSFPLIQRPDSMEHHAGQIGLPGGAIDGDESPAACALREGEEEIGLHRDAVEILGQLTPLVIPISGYRVVPFVARIQGPIVYRPQETEVLRVLSADPDRLAREGPHLRVLHARGGKMRGFPAYEVDGEPVWGATALILAEFLEIWRAASVTER